MFENKRLIKLTNSNDEIDQVIVINYMSIYKYCYYHVGNSNAAQDITQEVFLKFLKHIDRYKEYGKLRNYLYVIAKNCIRDYLRKAKQVNLETVIEGFDSGGIDRKLEQLNIWEAINSLEEIEKEIIILRYYQDFRIKDISQVMGIPASTARYKLKNAEKSLKRRLEI